MQRLDDWRVATVSLGCAAGLVLALAGCASPGNPLPPSLKLPKPATNLTAVRVGDEVRLSWANPAKTTDGMAIKGAITAEICRSGPAQAAAQPPRNCAVVQSLPVKVGDSQTVDRLPPGLAAGAPGLLVYRVQLKNVAGKTAGPSAPAYAASGAAPPTVANLRVKAAKAGAVVEWAKEDSGTDWVELERVGTKPARDAAAAKDAAEVRLRAGDKDAGGTVDRTAVSGESYQYSARRVREVTVGGRTLEMRGAPSAEVSVAMVDVFPPERPTGLVASPGFAGEGAARVGTIDLSWEPDAEAGIAGYRVYRRTGVGQWQRLGTELVTIPAYRDMSVAAGQRYAYRVTAVDQAGNESGASDPVEETGPAQ